MKGYKQTKLTKLHSHKLRETCSRERSHLSNPAIKTQGNIMIRVVDILDSIALFYTHPYRQTSDMQGKRIVSSL